MLKKLLSVVSVGIIVSGSAQVGFWPNDTKGKDRSLYAVKNITLYQDYRT